MASGLVALIEVSCALKSLSPVEVLLILHNLAAGSGEAFHKKLRQSHRVVLFHIGQHRHTFPAFLMGELRHHGPLKRIDEADAENVVADFRDLGVGRGRRDHRDFVLLADGRGFERFRRRHFAEHGDDFVLRDELAHDRCRLSGHGLIVLGDELQFSPEHAARRVDLVDGERGAFVRRLAETRAAAGERREFADFDFVLGEGGGASEDEREKRCFC